MEIEKNVIGRWPSIEPINLDLLEVVFYYQMEMEKSQLWIRKKQPISCRTWWAETIFCGHSSYTFLGDMANQWFLDLDRWIIQITSTIHSILKSVLKTLYQYRVSWGNNHLISIPIWHDQLQFSHSYEIMRNLEF